MAHNYGDNMAEVFGFYLFAVNCGCSSLRRNVCIPLSISSYSLTKNMSFLFEKMLGYYPRNTHLDSAIIKKKKFLVGTTHLNWLH